MSSAGFWPGAGEIKGAAFYAYAAPEPPGYSSQLLLPEKAFYHPQLHESILMYDDMRLAGSPASAVRDFLRTTYAAAANLGQWNRADLERASAA